MMKVEKDFVEFIELLNRNKARYVIVGAYALALYAPPRNTGDIDIFIENSQENGLKILNVLDEFGFKGLGITLQDLQSENTVIQLGVSPVRIDLLTTISGLNFNEVYESRIVTQFADTSANFISKQNLIVNKKASSRLIDKSDLELLGITP